MAIDIDCKVISGYGAAQSNMAKQLPLFRQIPDLIRLLPIIATCHPGTINIQLDQPLLVPLQHADFVTQDVTWAPAPHPPERFAFLEIEFECPRDSSRQAALIFIPFRSPHFDDLYVHEVIAPFIRAAATAAPCRIRIPKPSQCCSDILPALAEARNRDLD
jgi:hypothetical protein